MRPFYEVKIPWTPQPSSKVQLSVNNQYRPPVRGKLAIRDFVCRDLALTEIPLFSGPVMVLVWFCMPLPGSIGKSRRAILSEMPHDTPPELEDLFKTVKMSLRGVIWERDCQICSQNLQKVVVDHHQGSTLIRVKPIEAIRVDPLLWADKIRDGMDFADAYATA